MTIVDPRRGRSGSSGPWHEIRRSLKACEPAPRLSRWSVAWCAVAGQTASSTSLCGSPGRPPSEYQCGAQVEGDGAAEVVDQPAECGQAPLALLRRPGQVRAEGAHQSEILLPVQGQRTP